MTVNESLREYIKSHGISQTFIVNKTGISHSKLSDIVNGKRKITGEELLLIARALEVNADIFLEQ